MGGAGGSSWPMTDMVHTVLPEGLDYLCKVPRLQLLVILVGVRVHRSCAISELSSAESGVEAQTAAVSAVSDWTGLNGNLRLCSR